MLVYEVSEMFVRRGKLIFQIAPTKDGNSRLAIHTAFDFKRADIPRAGRFGGATRMLFPGFVHDVVWNHALCCIKEEVEGARRNQRESTLAV